MSDDPLHNLQVMLGAISNIAIGQEEDGTLVGARCPKCGWTGFAKVEAVYDAAVHRINWDKSDPGVKHEGGLTDEQIVDRLAPPRRKSPFSATIGLGILLGGASAYTWKRFGDLIGEAAAIATVVILATFLLTRARKLSDAYYNGRSRWRKLYLCRNCAQLVESSG